MISRKQRSYATNSVLENSFGEIAEELGADEPAKGPAAVRRGMLKACDAGFFQFRENGARAGQLGNGEVQMRRETETGDFFSANALNFLHNFGGIRGRFKRISSSDFVRP